MLFWPPFAIIMGSENMVSLYTWWVEQKEREYLVHLTHVKSFISEWLSHPAPASDSNVGLIPYNYCSHGNDCILSFQTDNSIWTQVIRFLGCGWYLSIICPVKREGTAARFLAAMAWNTNAEASPLLHSGNLGNLGFVGFEACIFLPFLHHCRGLHG